jgi:hypothetical protein
MTTQQSIDQQLQADHEKFINSIYAGKISVPVNILEIFKIGIMAMAPFQHRIQALRVKNILSKELDGLTNGDLNEIIKVVVNVPLQMVYDEIDEAIEKTIRLDKFVLCYNQMIEDFQRELQMRRAKLMELAGTSGGHLNGKNMRAL